MDPKGTAGDKHWVENGVQGAECTEAESPKASMGDCGIWESVVSFISGVQGRNLGEKRFSGLSTRHRMPLVEMFVHFC